MNILFMSLSNYQTIYFHGLYSDLLRQFIRHGDEVYIISPFERNMDEKVRIIKEDGATIARVKIWNMQKTNFVEKGISMLTIDGIFIKAIKKYFSDVKFDLILYPTPPITLLKAVEYAKKRDGAKTYLLLKDIFPQNAVDIGLMSTNGVKGLLYRYFRKQEEKLYAISDHIGCMSPANVKYVLDHNPKVNPKKVEVCPNTTDPVDMSCSAEERIAVRNKYEIPLDKTVFVYGGNLGKPQDIPFMIECIKACKDIGQAYFLIVGNGTEYGKIDRFVTEEKPGNVKLMQRLPKEDYDKMIGACDVGLIFLDHRFTIPNFPSRLLGYMSAKLPVLASTDSNTDIGMIITGAFMRDDGIFGAFGWSCKSVASIDFAAIIGKVLNSELQKMGEIGFRYLKENYSSENAYKIIMRGMVENIGTA